MISASYFIATSLRCHFRMVSGEKTQHISPSICLPIFLPRIASRLRCPSLSSMRLGPSFSRRILFSSLRYSIASCCRRFIQPANIIKSIDIGFVIVIPLTITVFRIGYELIDFLASERAGKLAYIANPFEHNCLFSRWRCSGTAAMKTHCEQKSTTARKLLRSLTRSDRANDHRRGESP